MTNHVRIVVGCDLNVSLVLYLGQLMILWCILGGFLSSELIKGRIMKKKKRDP